MADTPVSAAKTSNDKNRLSLEDYLGLALAGALDALEHGGSIHCRDVEP